MTTVRPKTLILVLGGLLALAACAGDENAVNYKEVGRGSFGRGGGGDPAARRPGIPNLFISPSGKPWRAEPGQPYPVAAWFAAADADHDGRLTREEFRKEAEGFFHELDTNGDGVIDGFEAQAYEQKVAPEILPRVAGLAAGEDMDLSLGKRGRDNGPQIGGSRAARSAGKSTAGDRRPEGAGVYGLLNEPEPVSATDTQFNSHITLAEWLAAADRRFDALDAKRQGYLISNELPKTPAQDAIEREAARRAKARAAAKSN